MRVVINKEKCMGNGLCESVAPDLFEVGEDGISHHRADPVPDNRRAAAENAARMCPMNAISLEDGG